MVIALVRRGFLVEAETALQPMLDRVLRFNGFFEWFSFHGRPQGSNGYHGYQASYCFQQKALIRKSAASFF